MIMFTLQQWRRCKLVIMFFLLVRSMFPIVPMEATQVINTNKRVAMRVARGSNHKAHAVQR